MEPTIEPQQSKKNRTSPLEIILLGILGVAVLILVVLLAGNAMQGGGLFAGKPTPSNDIFFEVIVDNVRAANAEDLDWYMSGLHPDGPGYEQTRQIISEAFTTYDLRIDVYDLAIVKQTSSEVQVSFRMVTRKIRGPAFRNNEVQGIFLLRQDDGVWKIYNQKVESVDYLD